MRKIIRISVSFIIVFTMLLTCNGVLVNADNEDTVSYQLVDNSQSAEITINPETIDNLEVENVNVSNSKGIVKEFTKSDSYQLTVSENDTYDIVVTYNDTDKTTKSYELKITDIKTNEESKTTENVKEEKTIESAKETTFTVKYHLNNATNNNSLATGAYFSSNNSQDLEVSNIASGTELKNAGYTYGTPSNASGYSNSGTIVNSNALLLCWRDASDTIYSTLDTVTTDLDLYAYWASDANKDGVMDQAVQDYVINTTIGGTLDGEITTKTGATQHKTTDVNGKTVYNISYNLFVATGSTLMSQMVPLMVGTSDYRNSDTYANLLKNKTGLIINSCNQPRTLSNAISSSMPTIIPDRGKKVVGFSTDSKVLTATDCLTYEPTSALQTYTATYGDIAKVKITYDLNDADAKFASNQKNILEVDAYVGEKLSQAGIVYGTPDGTKGAYKTTGDIVNNDKMLILWEDEEGNPVNIETVITQSMTLHAEWVTDQDNDGYPDGSIQKYELKTNEYGRFTKDPEMKKGGSFTTRYDPSDTSHVYPIYEIEYNEMINIGYDTTSFAQLIVMMKALRPNINYTSKIDTILKKVESARDSDKPLEKAFTTPPVHSGLSINPLIDWESDGNNLDDSTYLTYVPTSDDQKFTSLIMQNLKNAR
ncbi:MAG: hypothetical protein PHH04_02035 [Thomasclavelia sp.]|nr:hypothetical protein [Thomasclavelia sp.]